MKPLHWALAALLPLSVIACDDFSLRDATRGKGTLRWQVESAPATKSTEALPDTNDYILTVRDASGTVLYEGAYGDSPRALDVEAGNYTVGIVSIPFPEPAFDSPQYGDEQLVQVPAGQNVTVRLNCTLQNAGIRLRTGPEFLQAYPDGILYIQQGGTRLPYLYRESRIAYVKPGLASVLLYHEGQNRYETLFNRLMEPREVLSLSIVAPGGSGGGGKNTISVQTDTTKVWAHDSFVIGGNTGAPISVADVPSRIGEEGVWVTGYIVGGDLTSAGKNVKTEDITKNTHLALADRSSTTEKASCLAVELPQGKVRDALNLVSHPELIGLRVRLKGNLVEKYFGTVGMKGTADYEFP
ncbi:MAG: DUF4493 domain-containing protein [Bacteroidales bacterium]|nr:DUF4493 domain-containing protein [Bacteroidales bacterium]